MKYNHFAAGFLTASALMLVASWSVFQWHKRSLEEFERTETVTDTVIKFIDTPVPVDSVINRYIVVKVPVYADEDSCLGEDSCVTRLDSAFIQLPVTQKIYEDTTYKAWVSGYMPSLDSILVYQPVTTVTQTVKIEGKSKRWGLGVQAGIGVTPSKVEPYIGFGVTYNIFSW